jgi:hypothetical protein
MRQRGLIFGLIHMRSSGSAAFGSLLRCRSWARVGLSGLASRILKIGRWEFDAAPGDHVVQRGCWCRLGNRLAPSQIIFIESRLTVAPHHQRAHCCTRRPARLSTAQGRWSWCRSPSSMRKKRLEGAKHDDAAAEPGGCVGQRVGTSGYLTVDHCWLPGVRCAATRSFTLLSNLHARLGMLISSTS